MPDLLPIAEYATLVNRSVSAVRQKCQRGTLPGAVKMGRDWFIPAGTAYPDQRVRSGRFRGWRNQRPAPSDSPASDPVSSDS